ncbi:sensor histidine kinase [Nocardia brasiliensis]
MLTDAPSTVDWAIAIVSVLVVAGGVRWPFTTALVASGLLLLGFEIGDTGPVVAKVAAALALIELSARRSGWQPWVAACVVGATYLLHPSGDLAATGYRGVVMAGAPLLIGLVLRAARENTEYARREAHEIAQRRDAEVAAARAIERTAIARELHDLIAHHVSSTVLRVGVARHAMSDAPPHALEVLDDIHASGKQTLTDLRRLIAILRDPAMTEDAFLAPADLQAALAAVAEGARKSGIVMDVAVAEEVSDVDAVLALTLLRLTQEGVSNIAKHAGTKTVARLTIAVARGAVHFTLENDGSVGTPLVGPASLSGDEGDCNLGGFVSGDGHRLGLVGLRERVELLGGELTVEQVATRWRLAACLPVSR